MLNRKQKIYVMSHVCNQMYSAEKLGFLLDMCENRGPLSIVEVVREFTKNDLVTENGVYLFAGSIEALEHTTKNEFEFFGVL